MLMVKTELRPSQIHGLGLFAAGPIAAGTVVWAFHEPFDHWVAAELVEGLAEIPQAAIKHFAPLWEGRYLMLGDDSCFMNHSAEPNLRTGFNPDCSVACRDIGVGEELLEDYRGYDENFDSALCQ